MFAGAASVLAEEAEAVGVVNQDTELVLLFEGYDLVEFAQCAGHTVHAFGNQQHAAAVLFRFCTGAGEHLVAVGHVVVTVFVFAADVQTDSVKQAGMALSIVHDNVVAGEKGVDSRDYSLISEVEEVSILLLLEVGENLLEFLVIAGMAGHHAGAHRIGKAPVGCTLCISLAHLGMVCQTEVVV